MTPQETLLLERLEALTAPLDAPLHGPIHGYMRLRMGTKQKDYLLGDRTSLERGLTPVLDWARAPLSEAFWGAPGEDYELEHQGRLLSGALIERCLLCLAEGRLFEVQTEKALLKREDEGWKAFTQRPSRLSSRPEKARRPLLPEVLDDEQQAAVERPVGRSLLILGEAGFGKTTVALYRLAHLAAQASEAGEGFSALVLVPTEGLRRLSAALLSRLGHPEVPVLTLDRWLLQRARQAFPGLPRRDSQDASAAVIQAKRSPLLQPALEALVEARPHRSATREDLLHLFGDRALLQRAKLSARTIEEVLEHTRVQFSETSEEAFAHVDADRLITLDGAPIDEGTPLQDAMSLDAEDAPVLFELARLRKAHLRLPRYDHIVVDEAQELAPLELKVLPKALKPKGTLTLAGDEHQQLDETSAFAGWDKAKQALELETIHLKTRYRCPPRVAALADSLFGATPSDPLKASEGAPVLRSLYPSPLHQAQALTEALSELLSRDRQASVAIICRDAKGAEQLEAALSRGLPTYLAIDGSFRFSPGLAVSCVSQARGLEFDHVVIPDLDPLRYPDAPLARRALYLAITRTMHQLWLQSVGEWSPLMARSTAR